MDDDFHLDPPQDFQDNRSSPPGNAVAEASAPELSAAGRPIRVRRLPNHFQDYQPSSFAPLIPPPPARHRNLPEVTSNENLPSDPDGTST